MLDSADFVRGGLALLYLVAGSRAFFYVYKGYVRRWQERYILHLTAWISSGWVIYWVYVLIKFFDSTGSQSHSLLTALGRTWHVPSAVSLMLVQYLVTYRRPQ